ncbi:MAG TPA: hypothetical protein VHY31_14145 [Streptosporangiaceae bacterium]|nr:hypothetical protein [Streptosporangiaceae bacterium]
MLNLDDRPAPPELPQFRQDMERLLLAAARASSPLRPAAATRRARHGVVGLAAAAAGIGYAASGGAHPTSVNSGTTHGGRVHIHRAAFSVDTNPGGTVTLKLTQGQMFDPAALRQALARAGVPALVTVGSVCTVPGPSDALPQVLPPSPHQPRGRSVTTINPSAIPAREKLSIGYFAVPNGGGLHISLVPDNTPLTCTSTPPAPPRHGEPAR